MSHLQIFISHTDTTKTQNSHRHSLKPKYKIILTLIANIDRVEKKLKKNVTKPHITTYCGIQQHIIIIVVNGSMTLICCNYIVVDIAVTVSFPLWV